MIPKDIKSKFVTFGVILILVCSIFFTINVSAEWVELKEEGIWYDEFENTNDVTLTKCVNKSAGDGYIILEKGSPVYEYNYSGQSGKIEAYEHLNAFVEEGTLAGLLSVLISPELAPGLPITDNLRLAKIKYPDGESIDTQSNKLISLNPIPAHPIQHFRFKVSQKEDLIEGFSIRWWFGDYDEFAFIDEIEMRLWNYKGIQKWDKVGETAYTEEIINDDNIDIQYTFGINKYLSEDGYIDVLVIGAPSDEAIYDDYYPHIKTDFINLSVETIEGYWPEGTVVSDLIEIDEEEFGGWESVVWESSKTTEESSVTIQVLDEDDELIEEHTGTVSPMDISDILEDKIKLKAVLSSSSPQITPSISNWRVMWQKPDGYTDTFSKEYRIEETNGVEVEDGKVEVSEFSSNWEYFGKNPANTRSYDGKTITSIPDDYYWYSGFGVGGGYRTPVTSDGRVYVASIDKKIYAFNETQDSSITSQKPVDESNTLPFEVESCIAVADDYLIVGTSKPGEQNKLYALNKYNLSEEIWDQPYPSGDETICFTSPPVYEDGILYLSTWGGTIFDTPFLSALGAFLGQNNKLIALSIDDGNPAAWDPISLPSGSLSTPAVGGNFIYVGCQNMYGSSLFAYGLEDGEEAWNQTVGIIGRSSPVYADGTVFVCANDKEKITENGNNYLFAVDASDGEILWNVSIGQMDATSFIHLLKGSSFFYRLIEGFAPVITPAYSHGTLYLITPNGTLLAIDNNGEEKWSYEFSSELLNILTFYTASPLVVDNYVYVALGNGAVYAFNEETFGVNATPVWSYFLTVPGDYFIEFGRARVLASPILADGLLFISSTEDTINLSGRLYCMGNYLPNTIGNITSTTIHVPPGNWWNSFNADFNKEELENNTINFKILNEDGNLIKSITDFNESFNDISDVKSNGLKIFASFDITNYSEALPALDSWHLNWTKEEGKPYFIYPNEEDITYINQDYKECSIEVRDTRDEDTKILSGIDATTAKFKIEYKSTKSAAPKTSSWIDAICADESGAEQTTITANLENLTFDVYQFLSIQFRIRDLAGNQENSTVTTFRSDVEKPVSMINDIESFEEVYNEPFSITVDAEDRGDSKENTSGIKHVSIIYRYKEYSGDNFDQEWKYYPGDRSAAIYSWLFGEVDDEPIASGYYNLSSRAKDKAGNLEIIDEPNSDKFTDVFLFDDIDPEMITNFEGTYTKKALPRYDLDISDDHLLESLEYKLESETTWTSIAQNIDSSNFTIDWSLSESKWAAWPEGGLRYINFRITDEAGNQYETTNEDSWLVQKDENMSDFFIDLSGFAEFRLDEEVSIFAAVPDYLDVEVVQLFYSFSSDNENWGEYMQAGENLTKHPYSWAFEPIEGDGYYRFYTRILTVEGDIYTSPEQNINYTSTPTTLFIVLMLMTTILLFVTAIVLYRIKKKK